MWHAATVDAFLGYLIHFIPILPNNIGHAMDADVLHLAYRKRHTIYRVGLEKVGILEESTHTV